MSLRWGMAAGLQISCAILLLGMSGSVSAEVPVNSLSHLLHCPGAKPEGPSPFLEYLGEHKEMASQKTADQRCAFQRLIRLDGNYIGCTRMTLGATAGAQHYAAQQGHIRRHGKPSPLFTREAVEEQAILDIERGTIIGDYKLRAIAMAYGGESADQIIEKLFCQCFNDVLHEELTRNPIQRRKPKGC